MSCVPVLGCPASWKTTRTVSTVGLPKWPIRKSEIVGMFSESLLTVLFNLASMPLLSPKFLNVWTMFLFQDKPTENLESLESVAACNRWLML